MLAEKITLINETVLECFNEPDENKIVKAFTESGIKILEGSFGFVWLNSASSNEWKLIYMSPNLPYTPQLPRDDGKNSEVIKNLTPYFVEKIEARPDEYDVSPYMKSFVILPIQHQGNIYGNTVICFKESRLFSQEDKILCAFIGNSAAQAITINRLVKSEHDARLDAENQKRRFQALIENSYDITFLISGEGRILDVSPSAEKIFGYPQATLIGRDILEFIFGEDIPMISLQLQTLLQQPEVQKTIEFRYYDKNGSLRWVEATVVNMLSNPVVGSIVANVRDVTERKTAQETILHQALHDPLTHLPNRKEFKVRLGQALETAKRHNRKMALMFLDIDRFKSINDALGHGVGDTLLKVIGTRFASSVRAEDTVARFGGDEFLILLNEIHSPDEAVKVAQKILKTTAIPVQIGEHTFHPTVSIGISIYPFDGEDDDTLKKHADIALYRAKANGRNGYSLYDPSKDTQAVEKFSLENQLREAIAFGQIVLYYQPILSLKTGRPIAMEALARWQHPTKGLVLPNEFIPLAEETGLIVQLTENVLKTACRQHKLWESMGFPKFRVAVNLSAKSFTETEFIPKLENILKENEMDPSFLEVEITESVAMGNLELTSDSLKQLKKMGVRITIDDFGTGYSSLSYLKSFPIHSLKIDRSFVRHCITNEQDASITRTIISMAHSLNYKVIAEGVETDQQFNFLSGLGCNAAQGFYISHPLPAENVGAWLEEKSFKKKLVVPV